MPTPHRHKRDESRRQDQPSINSVTRRTPLSTKPTINSVGSSKGTMAGMGSSRSMDPERQSDLEPQSSTIATQESKNTSRSINITGSTPEGQGMPEEIGFSGSHPTDHIVSESDMSKELEVAKRQIEELNERIARMKQDMMQQVAAIPSQHERVVVAESQVKQLNKSLRQSQERAYLAETEAQNLLSENHRLKNEANIAIQSLTKDYSKKTAADEAQIRQLLDKVTRDKIEGKWNPLPDEDIRRRLTLLNNDMRDWAKTWATKTLSFDKAVNKDVLRCFKHFIRLDPDGNLPPLVRKPSSKMKERVGPLLLHAALAHQVHDAFFENPFFCTTSEQGAVLETLFNAMIKADHRGAHIWRAGLWRLLNPPAADDSSRSPPILENTKANVKDYCEIVSQGFRKGPASVLFFEIPDNSPESQNRASRLRHILFHASTVATCLWTQHSFFSTLDIRTMHKKGIAFDVTSPLMQGHPLSKVDTDDDKFNGLGITMVARPALVAFDVDDASGIDGDRYRVLAAAVVLLDGTF